MPENERRFSLVVDATCDIPREILEENGVGVIHIFYRFGDETYTSDPKAENYMSIDGFYEKLASTKDFPKTAQPPPKHVLEVYKKMREPVLVLTVSGELSGLHSTARLAARASRMDLVVYDTRNVSIGFGLLALGVIDLMNKGATREEAIKWLDEHVPKVRVRAYLDTLEYLVKGGRLSKTKGMVGNILGVRPIIEVRDGKVFAEEKVRKGRGARRLLELLEKDHEPGKKLCAVTAHATYTQEYEEFRDIIKKEYKPQVFHESRLGAIVGCHIGPGGFGIAYYYE